LKAEYLIMMWYKKYYTNR